MDRSQIFQKISESLRADFERIRASIPHSGEKGLEFENILIKFLEDHLPKRFSACSGFIMDIDDNVSSQQDVIIYDAMNAPLYSVDVRNKVVPNDNVAIVIEVKANLDNQDIIETAAKIEKIKNLTKTQDRNNPFPSNTSYATLGFIFAYNTKLNFDKIRELYAGETKKRVVRGLQIDGIFILDKGFISLAVHLPNGNFGPLYIVHSALSIPGAVVSVCSQDFNKETLDYFIRMLLPHLSTFYYRIDHPGFRWVSAPKETELYRVPIDLPILNT